MIVYLGKRQINIPAKTLSPLGKFTGLMFKTRKTKNQLFNFKKSKRHTIHSYFVFFPFLAIWLNSKNKVLDYQIVRPFTFSINPKFPSQKLIEVPINKNNEKIVKFFVDKGKV